MLGGCHQEVTTNSVQRLKVARIWAGKIVGQSSGQPPAKHETYDALCNVRKGITPVKWGKWLSFLPGGQVQ